MDVGGIQRAHRIQIWWRISEKSFEVSLYIPNWMEKWGAAWFPQWVSSSHLGFSHYGMQAQPQPGLPAFQPGDFANVVPEIAGSPPH